MAEREYPIWYRQWEIYPKRRVAFWIANGNPARWNVSGTSVWAINVGEVWLIELARWIHSQRAVAQGAG